MNLKAFHHHLLNTQIPTLYHILKDVRGETIEDFSHSLAHTMVAAKMQQSGLKYEKMDSEFFSYVVKDGKGWAKIGVSPLELVPGNKNAEIQRYIRAVNAETQNVEGVIQFAPHQMTGGKTRERIIREAPVRFVDLHYNRKSLEHHMYTYRRENNLL